MLALFTEWDWTEVAESFVVGIFTGLGFAALPVVLHARRLHDRREAEHERRHRELKEALKR